MTTINISRNSRIHCVGIGGIGVSALAKYFLAHGAQVSGSDLAPSLITDELVTRGVHIALGPHHADHVPADTALVLYSAAALDDNPELQHAHEKGIPAYSYPQMLGLLMEGNYGIAVSGTHGKSTTTSLLGLMLVEGRFDPTVIVGSRVDTFGHHNDAGENGFDGNIRLGKSRYFLAEACEWRGHMLEMRPRVAVLTNVDADHLDYYRDTAAITAAFKKFFARLPHDGLAVLPADTEYTSLLTVAVSTPVLTFGISDRADITAENLAISSGSQHFDLVVKGKKQGSVKMWIPGMFNIENALAACAAALQIGVSFTAIQKVLGEFRGIWRRFELVGEYRGATVISDYAHHPTAVVKTIHAAKEFYPGKRIVVAFQPHHRHRTKALFDEFTHAFDEADYIILNEIYDVAGREEKDTEDISSAILVEAIATRGKSVEYSPDLATTQSRIAAITQPHDIVLIMGAGDIDKVAHNIVP